MASSQSFSRRKEVSTNFPFTLPASAARASPGPIAWATSATVTGPSNDLTAPSGRRILGISVLYIRLRVERRIASVTTRRVKTAAIEAAVLTVGRRDWNRTNDLIHVKDAL